MEWVWILILVLLGAVGIIVFLVITVYRRRIQLDDPIVQGAMPTPMHVPPTPVSRHSLESIQPGDVTLDFPNNDEGYSDRGSHYEDYYDEETQTTAPFYWPSPYAPRMGIDHSTPTPAPHTGMLIPAQTYDHQGRYTIVLDMDETLVHSNEFPPRGPHGEVIRLELGYNQALYTYIRPYARQLLRNLGPMCELVLWTAGTQEYASTIMQDLDDARQVQHFVYRDDSWFSYPNYSKPLTRLGRAMDRTLIVDNTAEVCEDTENAIVIEDFRGNPTDNLLAGLEMVVKELVASELPVPVYLQKSPHLSWWGGYYRLYRPRSRA
eukprot:TRINITY_DN67463_c11_g3_i1.p1 TRINITY_DN67463_c11_g3~~TRINITY_DN67463_c11_g3_i1.p1  ORF type:complete len:321 (-),score=2.10 TRINITY_DN67463_c11_g3_i1:297-1259(-)